MNGRALLVFAMAHALVAFGINLRVTLAYALNFPDWARLGDTPVPLSLPGALMGLLLSIAMVLTIIWLGRDYINRAKCGSQAP